MRRRFTQAGKIGIIAVMAVTLICCHSAASKPSANTPAETACLKSISRRQSARLNARIALHNSDLHDELSAVSSSSQPAFDAAQAHTKFAETSQEIKQNTEYCTEYAHCYASKPFKTVFDACYAVVSEKETDPPDASNDN
jgi:hypothetical protein